MINKSFVFFVTITFLLTNCFAQSNVNCEGKYETQFEKTSSKTKKDGLETNRKMKAVSVEFLNNFNNKVKGYINGELVFDETVITDDASGISGQYFGYNYSNDDSLPTVKVDIEGIGCFEVKVLKKYKLIYVFLNSENKVIFRYSNTIYDSE